MLDSARAQRPEFENAITESGYGVVEQELPLWRRLADIAALRKTGILIVLAVIWQIYATYSANGFLVPRFTDTIAAFAENVRNGVLPLRVWVSVAVLIKAYAVGVALAALLTTAAITTRLGNDLLETLTAMLSPLPAIALLPLAMIWFGLGDGSMIFVLVHSVLWPVALNTHTGFRAVSPTLRMVGRNYGLSGPRYVALILIPAAFPSILSGLKIGWAFAWRTLIAAELVFGVSAGSGGLGWFIFENKNALEIPNVFAGLFSGILIGLFVDNCLFRLIEAKTVRRWGMQW